MRRLRGLDAFPNVQTLVLDSNGLLSLPMDCPWCPAIEALWLCNNEVENLDGLLCQVPLSIPPTCLGGRWGVLHVASCCLLAGGGGGGVMGHLFWE